MSKNTTKPENEATTDAYGRKLWSLEHYKKLVESGMSKPEGEDSNQPKRRRLLPDNELKPLTARDRLLGLKNQVGKIQKVKMVDPTSKSNFQNRFGGFYCEVCNIFIKDSNTFMTHLNSKGHLHASGLLDQTVVSTAADVKNKIDEKFIQLLEKEQKNPKIKRKSMKKEEIEEKKQENEEKKEANLKKRLHSELSSNQNEEN